MKQPRIMHLPPEIRGYIDELQEQVAVLSDRAASHAAEKAALRARVRRLEEQVETLQASLEPENVAQPEAEAAGSGDKEDNESDSAPGVTLSQR